MAFGFLMNGEFSYLRNGWNILDFLISMFSVSFKNNFLQAVSLFNIPSLKFVKMLRILRPLRLISRNEGLKSSVLALIVSIPNIVMIIIIVMLFFVIFGIIGVSYMKGLFYECESIADSLNGALPLLPLFHKRDCVNQGGLWKRSLFNFDNTAQAMITLV